MIADEWWRTLQDKIGAGKLKFSGITRVTPQFYLYDAGESGNMHIWRTTSDPDGAPEFRGKIIFSRTLKSSGLIDIIPVQDIVDHVSGNT